MLSIPNLSPLPPDTCASMAIPLSMQEVTASPMSADYAPRSRTHPPAARSPEPQLAPEPNIRSAAIVPLRTQVALSEHCGEGVAGTLVALQCPVFSAYRHLSCTTS